MTLLVVGITFLAALVKGGRIKDLDKTEIRHVWVFPFALVLMIGLNLGQYKGLLTDSQALYAQPAIYLVIIAGILLNRHIRGAFLLAFGTFLNFLVIAVNGGYMPVSMKALEMSRLNMEELADVMYLRHLPMTEDTRLPFLGDIIPVPWPPLLRSVGSVGDVVIMVALVIIVWSMFFPPQSQVSEKPEEPES